MCACPPSRQKAKGGKFSKSVLERKSAPTFDMVIELSGKNEWKVYDNGMYVVSACSISIPHALTNISYILLHTHV